MIARCRHTRSDGPCDVELSYVGRYQCPDYCARHCKSHDAEHNCLRVQNRRNVRRWAERQRVGAPKRRRRRKEIMPRRWWLPPEDALLRALYADMRTDDVAERLGRTLSATYGRARDLGLHKSAAYLASPAACRLRREDRPGREFQFRKGQAPPNKGLRRPGYGPGRMKETQFKKGQPSRNWMPVGAERLVDGYRYTKVSDHRHVPWTRNWRPTHVLLWERHRGPVPQGHALRFANRDRTDIRLENLELITRRELMARNTVHNLPKPLVETIQLLGALKRKINRRSRNEKQDRRSA